MLIKGTSSDDASATSIPVTRDEISSLIENKVTETLKSALPDILRNAFMTDPDGSQANEVGAHPQPKKAKADDSETPVSVVSSWSDKYYAPAQETTISEELTSFLKSAFTKQLSKDVWTNLMEQYPDIKGTNDFLVSPVSQSAAKQAPVIFVVRPLVSALQALEPTGEVNVDEDEPSGPDPNHIKALIEDAIVQLGNVDCHLNS
ncbi:hypothetical protein AWC38_SpisGene10283 [Stylophora pistillata]|uniref:Uncharacterized protein n=1 Tax=Stylophora pistillata TaxID=50429 RepID=A0A2B4S6U6_STYPI|nr:hypothetical protein AWC38_SpisGene10283 [Stylophora pistillata]